MTETCSSCKYWKFIKAMKSPDGIFMRGGICRLHPPCVVVPLPQGLQIVSPQTASMDWCGQWEINLRDDNEPAKI